MARIRLVDDKLNNLCSLPLTITAMPQERFGGKLINETFAQPELALERARSFAFDLVLSGFRMPEMEGHVSSGTDRNPTRYRTLDAQWLCRFAIGVSNQCDSYFSFCCQTLG